MPIDPALKDHQTWLGYLQPDGLVVAPAALVDAQVLLDRNAGALQQSFLEHVREVERDEESLATILDLPRFLTTFLEWPAECLVGDEPGKPVPETLKVPLREFGETLEPTFALAANPADLHDPKWLILVQRVEDLADLDESVQSRLSGWEASPTRRFERLLRESGVAIGLLSNGKALRLVYAPRGENSGTLTFPVSAMRETAGRPIVAALHMLLSGYRLLAAPCEARLPAILKRSRDYQSRVSAALAEQVLDALYELLRGIQAADDRSQGALLREVLDGRPDEVYSGLLTVLMRLVFLLYAEDRGLMPGSDLYVRNYAVHGLFERLRSDAERHPDTMEQRYGAWAQLVALFRLVHDGCEHTLLKMPPREGHLFDPERFRFLEGRSRATEAASDGRPLRLPLVPDGTVYRVLAKLLLLDGQRLSYRTLDVEQIGSVYETMMGFRLERTTGTTIALRPAKPHGAPVPINLEALLATTAAERAKAIKASTDRTVAAGVAKALRAADSSDALLAALEPLIVRTATPHPLGPGRLVLVPTDERRRTGSHYTPRSLTEPIVRTTLAPIIARLADPPTPDQILALKICDPAMGSGAFLVEACRQLGDALVRAWAAHGWKPHIPPDEDELLHARRLVAQRCLYGVDRNPMAVDLAKLSLWLATLARDHPFTFLDHSLRSGDSLVGLSRRQIVGFALDPREQPTFVHERVSARMTRVSLERRQILEAGDYMPPANKRQRLAVADEQLSLVRLAGDAVVAAFFGADTNRDREAARQALFNHLDGWLQRADYGDRQAMDRAIIPLRGGDRPVVPFHWEIEFPEVFDRENPGFDAFVGNPPFAGKNTIIASNADRYLDWLKAIHAESHGNADLVAHFFRRAFTLLRTGGTFGLIATNTIGQGDTRSTGLRWICTHGGTIFAARRRHKWVGQAAVVVSVVLVVKGTPAGPFDLDGRSVPIITAYLFHAGGHENPETLAANAGKSFVGSYVLGMGFTFDDTDTSGVASPIAEMHRLIAENPRNAEVIFPYIGGEEVNNSPTHAHHRFAINFGDRNAEECRERWPALMRIVEERVRPVREEDNRESYRRYWWQYAEKRVSMLNAIRSRDRVLVINCGATPHASFAFLPRAMVHSHLLIVFPLESFAAFATLQSRPHEVWARFAASSMKDDLRYTPSDCFETFPFPLDFETTPALEAVGQTYYQFRAELMVRHDEGLTKTYNRFHDPAEQSADFARLRDLHAAMDRALLLSYGWRDLIESGQTACGFALDHLDLDDDEMPDDLPELLWFPTAEQALAFAARLPPSRGRLPWRYRWHDDTRDEVLARLMTLNADRAAEERRIGAPTASAAPQATKATGKRSARRSKDAAGQMALGESHDAT
jgi:hypothetical protein